MQGNYLKQVKEQYEDYPYPFRDPKDEQQRLVNTALDGLAYLNHHVYGGHQSFRDDYTVLVAGGGTGDSTIYLAEQLRDMQNARVIYVDLSKASMEVAQQRASVRKLKNIEWYQMSLLDVANLGIKFDYINCSGVLHHLEDPNAGLKALADVLKPDGALGIMVYGQYGRTSVYQMQELLRLINHPDAPAAEKVNITKQVIKCLPASNLFRKQKSIWDNELNRNGDVGIYDLLLHSTDRAYTVPQLHEWLNGVGMKVSCFTGTPGYGLCYKPEFVFARDAELMSTIKALPLAEQQAVAELAHSNISRHIFYATRKADIAACVKDDDMIPFFFMQFFNGPDLAVQLRKNGDAPFPIQVGGGVRITIAPNPYMADILENIDEEQTVDNIINSVVKVHKGAPVKDVRAAFEGLYRQLEMVDLLLLRHKSVPAFTPVMDLQQRVA